MLVKAFQPEFLRLLVQSFIKVLTQYSYSYKTSVKSVMYVSAVSIYRIWSRIRINTKPKYAKKRRRFVGLDVYKIFL